LYGFRTVKPSKLFSSDRWCQIVLAADSVLLNVAQLYYLFLGAVLMWSEFSHF
jgi:hypothetical protein